MKQLPIPAIPLLPPFNGILLATNAARDYDLGLKRLHDSHRLLTDLVAVEFQIASKFLS